MGQVPLYSIRHKKISLFFLIFGLAIGSLVDTLPATSLLADQFGTIESRDVNGEVGVIGIDWGSGISRTPGANIEIYRQDLAGNETWIGYGFLRSSNLTLADAADTFDGSPLQVGDLVRIQQQSKICTRIGQTAYIVATQGLAQQLKSSTKTEVSRPDTKVKLHVYYPKKIEQFLLAHNQMQTFRWQEKICTLVKPRLVQKCKIKTTVIGGNPEKGNLVYIKDIQQEQRQKTSQRLFILKTEGDQIYLSRFAQPIVGKAYTLLKCQPKSDDIDPGFPICRIKANQIYTYAVAATYDNPRLSEKFNVGDGIKIID